MGSNDRRCEAVKIFQSSSPLTCFLLPVTSQDILPQCSRKNQNSLENSVGTWPTIVPDFSSHIARRPCSVSGSLYTSSTSPIVGVQISLYTWCHRMMLLWIKIASFPLVTIAQIELWKWAEIMGDANSHSFISAHFCITAYFLTA